MDARASLSDRRRSVNGPGRRCWAGRNTSRRDDMSPRVMEMPAPARAAGAVPTPDLEAIKTRQQAMWASGDYGQIGVRLQIVGETLCETVNVMAGERVLDVAAGDGNASLA